MYTKVGRCIERCVKEEVGLAYKKVGMGGVERYVNVYRGGSGVQTVLGWVEGYVMIYRGGSSVHKGRRVG